MSYTDLIDSERLPVRFASVIAEIYEPLANTIVSLKSHGDRGIVVGINGCQGSGKSTMAMFLQRILTDDYGLRVVVLSLDDLYFTRHERGQLARTIHPLLATRGVPGTHDLALGGRVIDELLQGEGEVIIPRFDKARDDRISQQDSDTFSGTADVILLEGWCIGITPLSDSQLESSPNLLEQEQDAEGSWRRYVNEQIAGPYTGFFARLDYLIMLRAPSFDVVYRWRKEQEEKLRLAAGDQGMTDAELDSFVMHFERWTRHMLNDVASRADALVELDSRRNPTLAVAGR